MAHQIAGAGDLSAGARLQLPATQDEIGRLTATFDEMLGRLHDSFQRERRFTADASHELRTPLATLQAILAVIRAERRTPEDYERALDDIAEQAERLRSLVEDLLSLARGDAQQVVTREPVDLSLLLLDVTDSLRPLAETKDLALLCDTSANLKLMGDTDALIRLFVNLVENAVKYTEAGQVSVTAQANPDMISVNIADTGIGIPSKHLPYIFNRFYRVDNARTLRGAGLGLAIAQDIVRAHGGTLTAVSTVDKGSTFSVHLPRVKFPLLT
jgi:signal transduction histidine kinase